MPVQQSRKPQLTNQYILHRRLTSDHTRPCVVSTCLKDQPTQRCNSCAALYNSRDSIISLSPVLCSLRTNYEPVILYRQLVRATGHQKSVRREIFFFFCDRFFKLCLFWWRACVTVQKANMFISQNEFYFFDYLFLCVCLPFVVVI